MIRIYGFLVFAAAILGCSTSDSSAGDKKGVLVDFDGQTSRAPAEWQEEKTISDLRYKQFKLPKFKDDAADAEIVIFRGIGGSTKDNIDRWKNMFRAPDGKTLADIAKITESKVGDVPITMLDVQGTYLFKAKPFDPNDKAQPRPNWRMIGVVYDGKGNVYHIRMVGPAATIEHYGPGFEQWLKNFK